jgi:hypothetical protein
MWNTAVTSDLLWAYPEDSTFIWAIHLIRSEMRLIVCGKHHSFEKRRWNSLKAIQTTKRRNDFCCLSLCDAILSRLSGVILTPWLLTGQGKTRSQTAYHLQFPLCYDNASAYGPTELNILTDVRDQTAPSHGHHVIKACERHGCDAPCLIYLGSLALNTCGQLHAPTALPQRREARLLTR